MALFRKLKLAFLSTNHFLHYFKDKPFWSDHWLALPQEALLVNPWKSHENLLIAYDFQNSGLFKVNNANVNHCHSESKPIPSSLNTPSKEPGHFLYIQMRQASRNPEAGASSERNNLFPNKVQITWRKTDNNSEFRWLIREQYVAVCSGRCSYKPQRNEAQFYKMPRGIWVHNWDGSSGLSRL